MIGNVGQAAGLEREGTLDVDLRIGHRLLVDIVKGEADACTRTHTGEDERQVLGHVVCHQVIGDILEAGNHLRHVVNFHRLGGIASQSIEVGTELLLVLDGRVEQTNRVGLDGMSIDTLVGDAVTQCLCILGLGVILVGHHQ